MTITVEKQRRGAFVRIVVDRIDSVDATPKQILAFEELVNRERGLGNGFLNSPTLQIAWFPRPRVAAVLAELNRIEKEVSW